MTEAQRLRYLEWKWERLRERESREPSIPAQRGHNAGHLVAENLAAVRRALSGAGVRHTVLPAPDSYAPTVVVGEADASRTAEALGALSAEDGWVLRTRQAQRQPVARSAKPADGAAPMVPGDREGGLLSARVYRNVDAPARRLNSRAETVTVLVYTALGEGIERVDGDEFTPGTLHRHPRHPATTVAYFEPDTWAEYSGDATFTPAWPPLIDAVTDPIDVVYTWVDGNDPAWLARKAERTGDTEREEYNDAADVPSRYADRDELRYSLRSLEMYAPWVRHIYIVTDRQRPAWLVEGHPRVTVVDHSEIFSDPSVLPVFNSHAIESQLHHIPGLSDRYLYINDDIMFGRPVAAQTFFGPGGLTKFFRSKAVLDVAEPSARDLPVLSAAKNNRALVRDAFGVTITQKFKHTPHPQRKDVLADLEATHADLFAQTQASVLRHPKDISITSALHHYWAYASGRAHEGSIRYGYLDLARPDVRSQLALLRQRRNLDVFCLNETNATPEQMAELDQIVPAFLEQVFPVPSSFEAA
ncbi:stealth family protein [Demequina globuliformis]|uniref:stealth family protein n=1 Tax=Demequina globuliformis TaxID=676202 RepID=UPI00078352C1|nr:stealth family protein [Demequina globuliformis]